MNFKRGDTFDFTGAVNITNPDGEPISLVGWTVASTTVSQLTAQSFELQATWVDETNSAIRLRYADSTDWPIGPMHIDVQFTAPDGTKVSTDTSMIMVMPDVTGA